MRALKLYKQNGARGVCASVYVCVVYVCVGVLAKVAGDFWPWPCENDWKSYRKSKVTFGINSKGIAAFKSLPGTCESTQKHTQQAYTHTYTHAQQPHTHTYVNRCIKCCTASGGSLWLP